jgi:quercetin dioxygenase-like cupin family protein
VTFWQERLTSTTTDVGLAFIREVHGVYARAYIVTPMRTDASCIYCRQARVEISRRQAECEVRCTACHHVWNGLAPLTNQRALQQFAMYGRLSDKPGARMFAECQHPVMKVVRLSDVEVVGPNGILARPFIEGEHSNVRVIRLAAGQALPAHRRGSSDLMLYVTDGEGELETPAGPEPFAAGALACYRGDEELRVRNSGAAVMTVLAFLAPKFAAG